MRKKSDHLIERLLKQLNKNQIRGLAGLIVCSAGASICDLILVVLLADLVSSLASGGGVPIRNLVVCVIATAWLTSLSRAGVNLWQSRLIYHIWKSLSNTLLTKLLYQDYNFYLDNDRNEISAKLQTQLNQLRDNIVKALIEAASSGVTAALLGLGILGLTGQGSLFALMVVLTGYGLQVLKLKPVMQRLKRDSIQAELESNNLILDTFTNIRRLLLERGQKTVLSQKNLIDQKIVVSASWSNILPHLPRQLVEPLGLSVVLLFLQIPSIRSNGSDALPWLALVTLGLLRLSQPMQNLSESYSRLQAGIPLLESLLPLLELPNNYLSEKNIQQLQWKELRLDKISQKYPENKENTLHEIDFTIKRGEVVAIAGESGSGKSTLSSIIVGLVSPEEGRILIDNKPLLSDGICPWQSQCSEISQFPRLLKGSVRTNLGGWSQPAPDTELLQALEQVDLRQRVEKLPKGLDSWIGDQGQGWSGGEQQRLAIAAAILRKPGLIVLDEATSGVQEALAEKLIRSLKNQPQLPAIVVITHREAIMHMCDRVLVIQQGAIVANGSLAVLKEECGALRGLLTKTNDRQASVNTDSQ